MAEAGGLQSLFEEYEEEGLMIITALNGSDEADAEAWAEEYGSTHPVLADPSSELMTPFGVGYWPFRVLIDRGMVIDTLEAGMSASDVEELL